MLLTSIVSQIALLPILLSRNLLDALNRSFFLKKSGRHVVTFNSHFHINYSKYASFIQHFSKTKSQDGAPSQSCSFVRFVSFQIMRTWTFLLSHYISKKTTTEGIVEHLGQWACVCTIPHHILQITLALCRPSNLPLSIFVFETSLKQRR